MDCTIVDNLRTANISVTETALVRVQNDILPAIDQRSDVVLVLLDLSAAFDTVDHQILLQRLRDRCGIHGDALAWCKSYLCDRRQSVVIGDNVSATHVMDCSVPQGSVAGPFMFSGLWMCPPGT